jgi:hypothetical protein
LTEEFINCRKCGREIPKTMYCIYCGSALSEEDKAPETAFPNIIPTDVAAEPVMSESIHEAPGEPFYKAPQYELDAQAETPQFMNDELDPETVQVLDELKKHHMWKLKLYGKLLDGGVTGEVFTKIYEEYVDEIERLDEIRKERIEYFQGQHEEKTAQLNSSKMDHEELRVRAEIGQIQESELMIRLPEVIERINALTRETSILEAKLSRLNSPLGEMHPREALELEKTIIGYSESIDGLVSGGKIDEALRDAIRSDLKATLTMLDGILGERKQSERELREELETLEVRFKVGEITLKEYESLRQQVLEKLEHVWI